ncbi:hypothetical protein BC834DRAFT_920638, partial [Gloeopeniophorella convolvens]
MNHAWDDIHPVELADQPTAPTPTAQREGSRMPKAKRQRSNSVNEGMSLDAPAPARRAEIEDDANIAPAITTSQAFPQGVAASIHNPSRAPTPAPEIIPADAGAVPTATETPANPPSQQSSAMPTLTSSQESTDYEGLLQTVGNNQLSDPNKFTIQALPAPKRPRSSSHESMDYDGMLRAVGNDKLDDPKKFTMEKPTDPDYFAMSDRLKPKGWVEALQEAISSSLSPLIDRLDRLEARNPILAPSSRAGGGFSRVTAPKPTNANQPSAPAPPNAPTTSSSQEARIDAAVAANPFPSFDEVAQATWANATKPKDQPLAPHFAKTLEAAKRAMGEKPPHPQTKQSDWHDVFYARAAGKGYRESQSCPPPKEPLPPTEVVIMRKTGALDQYVSRDRITGWSICQR